MLKSLDYSVTFASTGRALEASVEFQKGFGAITGPNGAGKSMILEMIRFCLFGSAALRGRTEDYGKLKAALVFDLKGHTYTIHRTINSARIARGDDEIAVGIRPVNEKVVQLLGFGMDVFDISCVANQDELMKLGSMRPTERKRLVDSVIGLGVLDDLVRMCSDEALAFNRRANDLEESLRAPIQPLEPVGYQTSDELRARVQELRALKAEADQIRGWLSAAPQKPVKPEDKIGIGSEILRTMMEEQTRLKAELAALPPPSRYTVEELDRFEQAITKKRFLEQYQQPTYTEAQLQNMERQAKQYRDWQEYCHAKRRLDDLLRQGTHECPNCHHTWPVAGDEVAQAQEEVDRLSHAVRMEEQPPLLPYQIEAERRKIEKWQAVVDQWEKIATYPDIDVPRGVDVEAERRALQAVARRAELEAKLDPRDFSSMYAERLRYEQALAHWDDAVRNYEAWQKEQVEKQAQLQEYEKRLADLDEVSNLYESCRLYEQALASYQEAKLAYDEAMQAIANFREQAEEWKKARTALTNLRGMVKQHLVPSLNKVASHLIDQMTGGQKVQIKVDEDFNILVDNQSIDTLSGSEKAVANLALRIGLGQVLTNNVLSLFMGDEIDASMDKNRAENTASTLQILRRKISQILLITHKYPTADYYISVGANSE